DDDETATTTPDVSTSTAPSGDTTSTSGTSSTSGAPTTTAAAGGIDPMEGASVAAKAGPGTTDGVALLERVEAARHEGYDRVVFDFGDTGRPEWRVQYVEPPLLEA